LEDDDISVFLSEGDNLTDGGIVEDTLIVTLDLCDGIEAELAIDVDKATDSIGDSNIVDCVADNEIVVDIDDGVAVNVADGVAEGVAVGVIVAVTDIVCVGVTGGVIEAEGV